MQQYRKNTCHITKQELEECRLNKKRMLSARERITMWQSQMEYMASNPARIYNKRNHNAAGIDNAICGIEKLVQLYQRTTEECALSITRVEAAIESLPGREAELLRMRYIDGYTWKSISKHMHYEASWCRRIHAAALEKLGIG